MGTTINLNFSSKVFACSDYLRRNLIMPSKTKEAGVSPGWTLLEMKIVGLSKTKGLVSQFPSGKRPWISGSLRLILPV